VCFLLKVVDRTKEVRKDKHLLKSGDHLNKNNKHLLSLRTMMIILNFVAGNIMRVNVNFTCYSIVFPIFECLDENNGRNGKYVLAANASHERPGSL